MRSFSTLFLASILTLSLSAQSVGPDVTVSSLTDVGSYGTSQGITAFAVGTVACNVGNQPVSWIQNNNLHPVIAQNMYQLINGRFQQIGMSWLKHGFVSTNSPGCGSCQQPPNGGAQLGIGCTDAYGSGLNGSQGYLGPRSEVNAATGYYLWPHALPTGDATIRGRLQVQNTDLGNASSMYFVEAQYVTADDSLAGNKNNNATWQRIVTPQVGSNGGVAFSGGVHTQQPAIYAWQLNDAQVQITTVDVPGDGRFLIGRRASSLGGGNYHYEIAVQNLNSDRSGGGFTVDFAPGTVITNAGFRSIPYHSGEPYSNAPWVATINGNSIHWACAQDYNGNALRWATMDNFWFDATASSETNKTIDLFKPAGACPADPSVPSSQGYLLNASAAFDNPTLTAPLPGPATDDSTTTAPIGFPFTFFGTSYTTVSVCSNGFLQFAGSDNTWTNACIPNANAPNGIVAGYWDDLNPGNGGQITYQTIGSAPNRRFVAFWNGVPHFSGGGLLTMKIILDETTNKITSTIISLTGQGGASATRGIENTTATFWTQASCSTAGSAVANTSQTYTPYATILPSANLTVTGSTGPGGVLTWSINSNARSAPVVLVASLDPGPLNLGALGTLNVGLTPGLYAVIADGTGALGAGNPADATDWYCGDFSVALPLGGGLPAGLTINSQGVVISTTSIPGPPNGSFHITTPFVITT